MQWHHYYKEAPKAARSLPMPSCCFPPAPSQKHSPNSSWEPWEGTDAPMSGLWRGWNLICTSCRALKNIKKKKNKEASLISLWVTKKSSSLRKLLLMELTLLEYTLVFSACDENRSWPPFICIIQLWHPEHTRGVSQPQHHAGLLPVGMY